MFILKVYIYLQCIDTQRRTTEPFDDTPSKNTPVKLWVRCQKRQVSCITTVPSNAPSFCICQKHLRIWTDSDFFHDRTSGLSRITAVNKSHPDIRKGHSSEAFSTEPTNLRELDIMGLIQLIVEVPAKFLMKILCSNFFKRCISVSHTPGAL